MEKAKIEQSRVIPEVTMPRMQPAPVMPQPAPVMPQPAPVMPQPMPVMPQPQMATQIQVEASMSFELTFPLIYYRAMPYIMMACDEMEMRGTLAPSQEETDQMTDRICDDMSRTYPDLAGMTGGVEAEDMREKDDSMPAQLYGDFYRDYDRFRRPRRRPRGRGFGDIVNILLLSELLRRRRRFY